MSFPEDFPAETGEASRQQPYPAVINCLRQRVPVYLAAADSFEGVTAEVLPLDTVPQARLAAEKYCIWKDMPYGVKAVADSMLECREEFSVLAISGVETCGFDTFMARAEVLEQQEHPKPELSDEEYSMMEQRALTGIIGHLRAARARLAGDEQ